MSTMAHLRLPHHPSLTSIDPLGICDDDHDSEEHINQGILLTKLLTDARRRLSEVEASTIHAKPSAIDAIWKDLLQDIAYSLHADPSLNTEGLREALPLPLYLLHSALALPSLFPEAVIPRLSISRPETTFSSHQVDTLLSHMLLGTLQVPPGNTWGRPAFSQCYNGNIVAFTSNTAPVYLSTLVRHFRQRGYAYTCTPDQRFSFHLSDATDMPALSTCELPAVHIPVTWVDHPSEPSTRDDSFLLVAAHAQPGPGPGGTQEERLIGLSPALGLASILTPALSSTEALITSPFPVHAAWRGHGRTAEMMHIYETHQRPWRRYVIADALPLDDQPAPALDLPLVDLYNGNVEREVRKLYAAFAGAKKSWLEYGKPLSQMRIEMPPWGCGAFGGNLSVKVLCMMMAAGLAGLESENFELFVTKDRSTELSGVPAGASSVAELYSQIVTRSRAP